MDPVRLRMLKRLDLPHDASAAAIKLRFKKIAMACHPDRCMGLSGAAKKEAEQKFKDALEAFEVLSGRHHQSAPRSTTSRTTQWAGHRASYRQSVRARPTVHVNTWIITVSALGIGVALAAGMLMYRPWDHQKHHKNGQGVTGLPRRYG